MSSLLSTLASYVPKIVARRVAAHPAPVSEPSAEQFPAAVMFADISGFSTIAEQLAQRGPDGAEKLSSLLNAYFGQIVEIVDTFGGDVVKFAGDAVLAIWPEHNVPDERKKQALQVASQRAIQCCVEIQTALRDFKSAEGIPLSLKLAVGCGDISMAHIGGIFKRWEIVVAGEPFGQVNKAEDLAAPNEIVLSPEVWAMVSEEFTASPLEAGFVRLISIRKTITPPANQSVELVEEMEAGLRAYIPGAILTRLTAGQGGWLAELRRVTVLFINLPDMNYDVSLEQAHNVMRILQETIYHYEGSVNKISVDDKGTTLIAVMGLPPVVHEDDEVRGLLVAMATRASLHELGWRCSIGVASGSVFCGAIGSETRREYTVMGEVVNLAARLMVAAKSLSKSDIPILCDNTTYEASEDVVEFKYLPAITVKGKSDQVLIYSPYGRRDDTSSFTRKLTASDRLVGRKDEKAMLVDQIQSLFRTGQDGSIIIEGEAGIGKSRLVAELMREIEIMGMRQLFGAGNAIEKWTPYHAWRNVFRQVFDLNEADDFFQTEEAQRRIRLVLKDIFPADHQGWERLLPLLNAVLPLDIPENGFTSELAGEVRGDNTNNFLVEILHHYLNPHDKNPIPTVLIMEDAHWLDSASWALLRQVIRRIHPLLGVIVNRPWGDVTPSEYREIYTTSTTKVINLRSLSSAEVVQLVCQRLRVVGLPPKVEKLILDKAEGHPFFSEELVFSLRDAGLIRVEDKKCILTEKAGDLNLLDFPDTIQGVITSRIDSLSPQQQMTLKVASVIGRVFHLRVLRNIYPIEADKPNLVNYLNGLERLEITPLESKEPDLTYIFKHSITQDVAYNLMLFSQRKQLHQAVADWYEQNFEEDLSGYYPLLAYHWLKAEVIEKAIYYLELSGEQALQNHANREAIDFFEEACKLAIADGIEKWDKLVLARWERQIGHAYVQIGDLERATIHIHQALDLLGTPFPTAIVKQIFGILTQVGIQLRHRFLSAPSATRYSEREIARFREVARAMDDLGEIHYFDTETLPILLSAIYGLNYSERIGVSSERVRNAIYVGYIFSLAGLRDLSSTYMRLAYDAAAELGHKPSLMQAHVVYSLRHIGEGNWDACRERLLEARMYAVAFGDQKKLAESSIILEQLAYYRGDFQMGFDYANQLEQDVQHADSTLHLAWSYSGKSENLLRLGDLQESLKYAELALDKYKQNLDYISEVATLGLLAQLHIYLDNPKRAVKWVTQTEQRLSEVGSPTSFYFLDAFVAVAEYYLSQWQQGDTFAKEPARRAIKQFIAFAKIFDIGEPRAKYYQGWYAWLDGKHERARRVLESAAARARELNMPYDEGLAYYLLGRNLTGATSSDYLNRARNKFAELKAGFDLARTDALLAETEPPSLIATE